MYCKVTVTTALHIIFATLKFNIFKISLTYMKLDNYVN